MRHLFATITLAATVLLFAIVSNLYQPTMDFNVHCTVHDRVAAALGGGCDALTGGIDTSFTAVAIAAFVVVALAVVRLMRSVVLPLPLASTRSAVAYINHIHRYYCRGIAPSRKFL